MGPPNLRAALLPDIGAECIEFQLNLPAATIALYASPQEAAERCKSNLSALLIPRSKTESAIDFLSSPVLMWQVSPSPKIA